MKKIMKDTFLEVSGIYDSYIDPVYAVNREKELIYYNTAYKKLAKIRKRRGTEDKKICHTCLKLDICDDACLMNRLVKSKKVVKMAEIHTQEKLDQQYTFYIIAIPLFDTENDVYGAVVIIRDMSIEENIHKKFKAQLQRERKGKRRAKEMSKELEKINKELQKSNKQKDDLLNVVSHGLRTPLTSIKAYTETILLMGKEIDINTQREFLGIISDESDRLGRMITNYLDLRKMEAGDMDYHKKDFDLKEVIESLAEIFKRKSATQNITLLAKLSQEPHRIYADPDRIKQVFSNLISNAVKYNHKGGKVLITSKVSKDDGVEVIVRDNGIGIAKEKLGTIFDKSMGKGLAMALNIIDVHEGKIGVQSEPDKGTTFIVSLPMGERERSKV